MLLQCQGSPQPVCVETEEILLLLFPNAIHLRALALLPVSCLIHPVLGEDWPPKPSPRSLLSFPLDDEQKLRLPEFARKCEGSLFWGDMKYAI